ncbi:MAG: hypothetical protein U0792_14825 [Gemmataceae bacterium]
MSQLDDEISTSTTLLRRVAADPTDDAAWDSFVERYGRMVFRWCQVESARRRAAEDVTQRAAATGLQCAASSTTPAAAFVPGSAPLRASSCPVFVSSRAVNVLVAGPEMAAVWRLLESPGPR